MNDADAIRDGLDPDQAAAVSSTARHTLVVAGPGSGKTRVLAARYALVLAGRVAVIGDTSGSSPEKLLALTFTNRAGEVMKQRVAEASGRDTSRFPIGTFHSFCLRLLRGAGREINITTRQRQESLLKDAGVKGVKGALKAVSRRKNLGEEAGLSDEEREVCALYSKLLKAEGLVDLDDLITEATALVKSGEVPPIEVLLIDEFQDINPPQAKLVRAIVNTGASLFAIGDPDQTIYSFRGANLRGFTDFTDHYPGGEVFTLRRNYRSTAAIVRASAKIIGGGGGCESVESGGGDGGPVVVVDTPDERGEAAFIAGVVERAMGGLTSRTVGEVQGSGDSEDAGFSDFAVLLRTNGQARQMEKLLSEKSIPCQLVGPRLDTSALIERLRGTGFSEGDLESEAVREACVGLAIDERHTASLVRTARALSGKSTGRVGAFIDHLLLMRPSDLYDVEVDAVAVMTMHAAKGLEFPVVFVAGAEEGTMPLVTESVGRDEDMAEERRLFYVAMTRAERSLYLTRARTRHVRGKVEKRGASPFLSRLPGDLVKTVTIEEKKRRRRAVQKGLFD